MRPMTFTTSELDILDFAVRIAVECGKGILFPSNWESLSIREQRETEDALRRLGRIANKLGTRKRGKRLKIGTEAPA